jgi:hypothetical protein
MNFRPEVRGANEDQEEHQLFIALRAEQSAQRLQPRRSVNRIKKDHGARGAKAAARIGVEIRPVAERRGRLFQRAKIFRQFLFGRHRLFEQRQRLLGGERRRAGIASYTTTSEQERAVARHAIAGFIKLFYSDLPSKADGLCHPCH